MTTGSRRGAEGLCLSSAFRDDEGGFTTVAVAIALLLCMTLVFAAASAEWLGARSAEVQRVADAAAMSGASVVAAYSTVAQVLDACVLSMGLTGIITLGAGLVVSCVPGLSAAGARVTDAAVKVLDARQSLAASAASGLQRLERALPMLVVANSMACVEANEHAGLAYLGCAIPFPLESESDFSSILEETDASEMSELSDQMGEASDRAEEARERADAARERGWRADCVAAPRCLRERAERLAGLAWRDNPDYPSPEEWTFGAPLVRARAYYSSRLASNVVVGANAEELTDAACREAFYDYALDEVMAGSYVETANREVLIDLPSMPRTADEVRATRLFTLASWPCTSEAAGRTLHSAASCPGAKGVPAGTASLSQLEAGGVRRCGECGMDVSQLGRVASASSVIDNGFEYHWRIVVEAAEEYEQAMRELAEVESEVQDLAEKGEGAFTRALDALVAKRPKLCPPGAWGCVAVVARAEGAATPSALVNAFSDGAELPAGAAVAAAALAPDDSTVENNVLARFFDGVGGGDSVIGGVLDGVGELWGRLLIAYGSAYESVANAGGRFLDGLDGVFGGTVGAWLKTKIKGALGRLGLEPSDMRLRKPVLVNTQDVMTKSGYEQGSTVRSLVSALPDSGGVGDYARAVGLWVVDEYGEERITVAEIEVPGTGIKIPLTISVQSLAGLL